jgi:hypothetical protein
MTTEPNFDAVDAYVVRPLQPQLLAPNFRLQHAILANLDDVDATAEASMPRYLVAREFVVIGFHRTGAAD